MKHETIDFINIGLLIIAFVTSIFLPFELFLFSYAFLGPLHYLTEINWLDDKNYFLRSRARSYKVFMVLALIISIYPLLKYIDADNEFLKLLSSKKDVLLFMGFVFSVSLLFITKVKALVLAFFASTLLAVLCFLFLPRVVLAIGIFLPTLIHVYIFTLLFMVYGLLKKYSNAGLLSVLLHATIPILIVFLDIIPKSYEVSEFAQNTFLKSGFMPLNTTIASLFGSTSETSLSLMSPIVIKVQVFIAFAYTYHYLNWFSKTTVIGWKKSISSSKLKYILAIWIASVGIYLYDYVTGLIVLFFLSLLHVVLEFPLNAVTIKEIGYSAYKKIHTSK